MEVRAAKVTGKLILNLLKKLMKEAEKLGGLEKLVNSNGNEIKLKKNGLMIHSFLVCKVIKR